MPTKAALPPPLYMTISEVARLLHVSRSTVYSWIATGELDDVYLGDRIHRVTRASFDKFTERRRRRSRRRVS